MYLSPNFRHCAMLCATMLSLLSGSNTLGETAVPVSVAPVVTKPVLREVEITGSVTSPQASELSPATEGLVNGIYAEEGDRVARGDKLLTLDMALAEQQLAGAKAQVNQAEAVLRDARRRLGEAESLGPRGGMAETLIENIRTEVAQAQAGLSRARAEAAQQQTILSRHTLKAPFAGVISRRLADLGEWVAPGQSVFELVATDNLRLDFALSEDFLTELSSDTEVLFRLNALPGREFQGRVSAVVPVADPGARTFLMRIVPEDDVPDMMPGLSAIAEIRTGTNHEAPVVPEDALLRYPDGRTVVWTVENTGTDSIARERRVSIGEAFDGLIAITEGLNQGDVVVVRGNEALQEGQKLSVSRSRGGE